MSHSIIKLYVTVLETYRAAEDIAALADIAEEASLAIGATVVIEPVYVAPSVVALGSQGEAGERAAAYVTQALALAEDHDTLPAIAAAPVSVESELYTSALTGRKVGVTW